MGKNYILDEIQCCIDTLTKMHSELENSNWKLDAEITANDISHATSEGRSGAKYSYKQYSKYGVSFKQL